MDVIHPDAIGAKMDTALAKPVEIGIILPPGCTGYQNGLDLPRGLRIEQWEELMFAIEVRIGEVAVEADVLQWWLADCINFGEAEYGERYANWINQTKYTYGSLANIAWVGRSVPPEARHPDLYFYHHQAVAPLQDPSVQRAWLDKAIENEWSGRELANEIARARIADEGGDPDLHEAERGVGRAVTALEHVTPALWADVVWERFLAPLRHLCANGDYQEFLGALIKRLEQWRNHDIDIHI